VNREGKRGGGEDDEVIHEVLILLRLSRNSEVGTNFTFFIEVELLKLSVFDK
jgi:hypothetical protein